MAECSFIELAAGSIRAGILQGHGKKAKLTAFHEEKLMVSDDDIPKVLSSVIEGLVARLKLSGKSVVFGISSKYLIYRVADFPFADKKRVSKTLPFQIEENLPLSIDEVIVDAFEVSSSQTTSKWFACCVPKKLMTAIVEGCHNSKIEPISVSPSFTGIPAVMPSKEMSLIIDIGGDTTDLLIVKDKKVRYCRTLRLAGKSLSSSLSSALSVGIDIAEKAKLASEGFNDSDMAFLDVLNAESKRLVREIKMTLSTIPEELAPKQIYLLGGGASIKGLDEYLKGKLNLDVSLLETNKVIGTDSLSDKPTTSGIIPPAGLAIFINSNVSPCVNFRKDEFAYHGVFDAIAWPLLILLFLITGILGVFAFHFFGVHKKHTEKVMSANEVISSLWKKVMPEEAKVPNELRKFPAFIDKQREILVESKDIKARYYVSSVLLDIKKVREFFRRANVKFETISMDASKSRFKLIIKINESEAAKVNEVLTRARKLFKVDQQSETRKDARRYTITFTKIEGR